MRLVIASIDNMSDVSAVGFGSSVRYLLKLNKKQLNVKRYIQNIQIRISISCFALSTNPFIQRWHTTGLHRPGLRHSGLKRGRTLYHTV